MKTAKMLTILVLALCLVVCQAKVSEAAPMGTAFTYQGYLMDKNKPADGLYDFQFKLYDSNDPCTGVQLGSPIDINDLDVIDGHFVVELDFGSGIFDGNAVWLETRVVESPMGSDPATLRPLLELTPTPYALYADSSNWDNLIDVPADIADGDDDTDTQLSEAQVDAYVANNGYLDTETDPTVVTSVKDGISWSEVSDRPAGLDDGDDVGITSETDPQVGSNAANYIPKWNGSALVSGTIYDNGNVGIGTTSPTTKLEVNGNINLSGGGPTYKITNVASPIATADVATKGYVDAQSGGGCCVIYMRCGWVYSINHCVSESCSCTPPSCPSGYTDLGTQCYITGNANYEPCGRCERICVKEF